MIKNFFIELSAKLKTLQEKLLKLVEKFKLRYRKENKSFTVPTVKFKNTKSMRILLWVFIFWVGTSGIFANRKVNSVNKVLTKQSEALAELTRQEKASNLKVEQLPYFLNTVTNFVNEYINVPNDMESAENRLVNLRKYFARDIEVQRETVQARRILQTQKLENIKIENEVIVAIVRVNYDLIKDLEIMGSEYTPEEISSQTALLHVPFLASGDSFVVIDFPSFAEWSEMEIENSIDIAENYTDKMEKADGETVIAVESFMAEFFTKYANGTKGDMEYMMKNPQALGGNFQYSHSVNEVFFDGEKIVVSSVVTFKHFDIKQVENLLLVLGKHDEKFYVEQFIRNRR